MSYYDKKCSRDTNISDRFSKSVIKHTCISESDASKSYIRYVYTEKGSYETLPSEGESLALDLVRGDVVYENLDGTSPIISDVGAENCEKDGCYHSRSLDIATTSAETFDAFVIEKINTDNEYKSRGEFPSSPDSVKINFITRKVRGYDILFGNGYSGWVQDVWENVYIYIGRGKYYSFFSPTFDISSIRRITK
jgi:hypothetical protein